MSVTAFILSVEDLLSRTISARDDVEDTEEVYKSCDDALFEGLKNHVFSVPEINAICTNFKAQNVFSSVSMEVMWKVVSRSETLPFLIESGDDEFMGHLADRTMWVFDEKGVWPLDQLTPTFYDIYRSLPSGEGLDFKEFEDISSNVYSAIYRHRDVGTMVIVSKMAEELRKLSKERDDMADPILSYIKMLE